MWNALQTLFLNAFGSDVHNPYTAEYAWLENQMSHFMMGFFLAAFWAVVLRLRKGPWLRMWVPFALILGKDVADFLIDVYRFSGTPFRVWYWKLVADALTDIFFWWFGMAMAFALIYLILPSDKAKLLSRKQQWQRFAVLFGSILVVCVPVALLVGKLWVNEKRGFDNSDFPFDYTRLPDLHSKPLAGRSNEKGLDAWFENKEDAILKITEFQDTSHLPWDPQRKPKHYVITGGTPFDRRRLAIAMGCEYSLQIDYRWNQVWKGKDELQSVWYTTATKLLDRPPELVQFVKQYSDLPTNQESAIKLVIVDDVDVRLRIPDDLWQKIKSAPEKINQPKKEEAPKRVVAEARRKFQQLPKADQNAKKYQEVINEELKIFQQEPATDSTVAASVLQEVNDELAALELSKMGEVAKDRCATIWVMSGDSDDDKKGDKSRMHLWKKAIAMMFDLKPDELIEIKLKTQN